MNQVLRKIAFFIGLGLLGVSMYWSQDGFNFDIAGDSGYQNMALMIGWFLAISVSVLEFIFSSNFKDLNPSLIVFGLLAYVYSIYTNHGGVLHFQGGQSNNFGAWILGILMDAVPEPMIAWGLYESKAGDFVGNLIKSIFASPDKIQKENMSRVPNHQPSPYAQANARNQQNKPKGSSRREELEKGRYSPPTPIFHQVSNSPKKLDDTLPPWLKSKSE